MQRKPSETTTSRLFQLGRKALAIEICVAVWGFGYYVTMNRNRDFRLWHQKNFPSVLNAYYYLGESINEENKVIRENDLNHWKMSGEIYSNRRSY